MLTVRLVLPCREGVLSPEVHSSFLSSLFRSLAMICQYGCLRVYPFRGLLSCLNLKGVRIHFGIRIILR